MPANSGHPVQIADTATKLDESFSGNVVVCGSHGGEYPAFLVARAGCRAVILNDAGIGLDQAGTASLGYLEQLGMAAAVVDTHSARIGDARDMLVRGRISRANNLAAQLGVEPSLACRDAAELLLQAKQSNTGPVDYLEARAVLTGKDGEADMVLLDSVSLVKEADKGAIIITGSHGGLVGGRPETALRVDGYAGIFHDAGGGADGAGLSRLPVLDGRGIIGATVAASSARIGDGQSIYYDGVISHVNETAMRARGKAGQTCREFVALIRAGSG